MTTTGADPLVGKLVSHYEITAKLGGGGMGIVYAAKDTRLGRLVALKFLPPQWSHDDSAKQRFIREAQAASSTDHRNICTIHNIETTDDGQLFIVMAHYEGETLKQRLERGALGVEEAVDIAAQIAEGLAKAHAQGVVHRDIKPGNLMVTEDAVKILDFGLAKFADSLQLTIPGSTLGTVAYMAPEQARGEEADARSDIWALGVVLYQMLTGEVPFKGAYAEAISYAIRHDPPPPLNVGGREIPEGVERVVLRALEKEPAQRFQSAREMARELRLLQGRTIPLELRTEPVPTLPPRDLPMSRWRRIRRAATPVRAIAVAAVVLLLALGAYRWLMRPVARIPVAIVPVANLTGEEELDPYRLALSESLVDAIGKWPSIQVVSYQRVLEILRRYLDAGNLSNSEAIQAIASASGARFLVVPALTNRGEAWQATAEVRSVATGTTSAKVETAPITSSLPKDAAYRLMPPLAEELQKYFGPGGALDPVLGRLGASLHVRQQLHDLVYGRETAPRRLRTLDAAQAFEQGLNEYEQMEYSSALAGFQRSAALDDQYAITHAWLSRVWLLLKQANRSNEAARRARQLLAEDTPTDDRAFVEGIAAESRADFAPAEQWYRQLTLLGPDSPSAYAELADFLRRRDRSQEAAEAFHKVLGRDARYVRPHVELCQLYAGGVGNLPLAERHGQIALKSYQDAGNRGGQAQALLCLAEAQRRQTGHVVEARHNVAEARRIFHMLNQAYNLSRTSNYQGLVEYNDGNFLEAARFFQEAVSRSRAVGNRLLEGIALMNLGGMLFKQGQRSEAVAIYEQSRDVFADIGDERRAAETTINAANVRIDYGGDPNEALRQLANARAVAQRLGYVGFEVLAMQGQASSHRNAGRLTDARKQFVAALNLARNKQLGDRVSSLIVEAAESDYNLADYEAARKSLEELVTRDTERKNLKARTLLGRVHLRLGDRNTAKKYLETVSDDITAQRLPEVAPLAYTTLGELALDQGNLEEARAHFERASGLWTDKFPDAASVEARSYISLLDFGRNSAAFEKAESSLAQARKMHRLALEAKCSVNLARIYLKQQRYRDAFATLANLPLQEGEPTIGKELQAQVRYWRSLALAGQGNRAEADRETALARKIANYVQESLPASFRASFAARHDIRPIFEQLVVR